MRLLEKFFATSAKVKGEGVQKTAEKICLDKMHLWMNPKSFLRK